MLLVCLLHAGVNDSSAIRPPGEAHCGWSGCCFPLFRLYPNLHQHVDGRRHFELLPIFFFFTVDVSVFQRGLYLIFTFCEGMICTV